MTNDSEEDDNLENEWPFVDVEQACRDVYRVVKDQKYPVSCEQLSILLDKPILLTDSALEMAQDRGIVVQDESKMWILAKGFQ